MSIHDCTTVIRNYLVHYGYDELKHPITGCACMIDDLIHCKDYCGDCEPGHYVPGDREDEEIMRPGKPDGKSQSETGSTQ